MAVISAHDLTMEFPDNVLFDGASFDIEEHDKVGLIGANGVGKTTLFKLIAGIEEPTAGNIFVSSKAKIGIVEQHACSDFSKTAKEEMLSVYDNLMDLEHQLEILNAQIDSKDGDMDCLITKQSSLMEKFRSEGGLTYRSRASSMLSGLGFTQSESNLSVGDLSGGQRTKLSLGKLLLSDSNLILLDEPTNHLDIKSVEWLENFMSKYNGTALIVSHDRYFLDKITNKTMEIEHKKITVRRGNYSVFASLKAEQRESDRRKYVKQTAEIERIQGIIKQQKQFNRERNYITIASKQKQIDRIKEELVEIDKEDKPLKLTFTSQSPSGNDVIMATDVSKSYSGRTLFQNVTLNIYKGERVFLLGANGCGKSTLLKVLLGKITPDSGYCRFGANIHLGYFDQIQSGLNSSKTVLEELYDAFPSYTISELRGYLGAFKFSGENINKVMRDLSGGERARVALLELMMKKPNLLILDEPTNHLDIESREVLEDALADYDGTMLCVSHDRFLVNKLSSRILILDSGKLTSFDGSYDEYAASLSDTAKTSVKQEKKPNEYQLRKERESLERKRLSNIKRIEKEIEETENLKVQTEREIQSPETASDYERLVELTEQLNSLIEKQDTLYDEWMKYNS